MKITRILGIPSLVGLLLYGPVFNTMADGILPSDAGYREIVVDLNNSKHATSEVNYSIPDRELAYLVYPKGKPVVCVTPGSEPRMMYMLSSQDDVAQTSSFHVLLKTARQGFVLLISLACLPWLTLIFLRQHKERSGA